MEKISRSRKKRAAEALQKAGAKLVGFSQGALASLDIPAELKDAVTLARRLNHKTEAYRRQIQYIGRLMRELDAGKVEAALQDHEAGQALQKRHFALIERWRDQLVAGDDERLEWIASRVNDADRSELDRLVNNARGKGRPSAVKTASRELFRFLNALGIEEGIGGRP